MIRVFVDGGSGTTGLRIGERLAARGDVERIMLSEERRKDPAARKEALNSCDAAFLCLPDAAAREAVAMVENKDVVILDASTAHRTQPGWAYGFPELSERAPAGDPPPASASRCPGATPAVLLPWYIRSMACGLLAKDARLVCHSVTGYSGGGKKHDRRLRGGRARCGAG